MAKKKIFLSYRRDDIPGYVGRLEDELEKAFGAERVFRDVEDIAGGSRWKEVIEQNLREAGALVLIIGPRWADIWKARIKDPVNYVALELQRAQELGVAIIPVTLDSARLPSALTLDPIDWLHEMQAYDISDKQSRWKNDVQGLIRILENVPAIGKQLTPPVQQSSVTPQGKKSGKGKPILFGIIGILATLAVIGALVPDESGYPPSDAPEITSNTIAEPVTRKTPSKSAEQRSPEKYPDVDGTWISQKDNQVYYIDQFTDGSFDISSPGYTNGRGKFHSRLKNKVIIEMDGVGKGEFDLSTTGNKIQGWIALQGTTEKLYDSFIKTD